MHLETAARSSPVQRLEFVLVLSLLLLAALLRGVALDRVAIEHFDEGVYASNLWFPDSNFEYPGRHLFAPPVVPALIEWSHLFFGEGRWVALLPGLVLGSATVVAVWWASRRAFGAAAAVASAAFVATNEFHIGLSRSALTDVPLLFFLVLAVGCTHRALLRIQVRWVLGAGICAGLAWATKYNGWLPLAIGVSGSGAAWLFRPRGAAQPSDTEATAEPDDLLPSWRQSVLWLAVIVAIAVMVWSPVWWELQSRGGYSVVAANHRQYVVGLTGWWPSWIRQEQIQMHLAGWLTWGGSILAVALAGWVMKTERSTGNVQAKLADTPNEATRRDEAVPSDRSTGNDSVTLTGVVMAAAIISATVLNPLLILVIWPAIDWVASVLRMRNDSRADSEPAKWLGLWICLAWLLGLLLATPLYRPYPRLALPLMGVGWIGMGSAITRLLAGRLVGLKSSGTTPLVKKVFVFLVVLMAVISTGRAALRGLRAWPERTELADAARQIISEIRRDASHHPGINGVKAAVYVFGEPGLFYHLPQPDLAVQPIRDLGFARADARRLPLPTYLITGRHAAATPAFKEQFAQLKSAFEIVTVAPYRSSDFVMFDEHAPRQADEHRAAMIHVRRLKERD